jgi:hypothetical protein
MEESIEGYGAVVLALVEEIHAQPQAVVGSLEAHFKEELAGVEMRVRDKIQELRSALQQQDEAAKGDAQRGEDMAQEGMVQERLQGEVERRAAGCDEKEEESLSKTEANASSDGAELKKKKRELPEDAGHDERERGAKDAENG